MNAINNTILLVEDNRNHQLLIQEALHRANLAVCVQLVEDGQEAVRYLKDQSHANGENNSLPVLIMTNLDTPRMSGLELLTWLKQQPEMQNLPVVVMSDYEQTDKVNQALKLGAHSYFVKTPSFDNLEEIVPFVEIGQLQKKVAQLQSELEIALGKSRA